MLHELESRLHQLEIKCRRPVEHLLAGEYRSVFRGRGIEFEDVRLYQPGDDVRTMDWKVTARTGQPHIKRYIEEREQYIYLLVDVSASMLHGSGGKKRNAMAEICALITMAAVKNQDRVGLILFTDTIEQVISPGKGRSHAMRIIDELMHFQPVSKGTDFVEMLGRFGHTARKHSVAFVVSDFLTTEYASELQALAFRHDINAIHIHDEKATNLTGLIRMEDSETGEQQVADIRQDTTPEQNTRLREEMLTSSVSLLDLEVHQDCVEALTSFFHTRQRQSTTHTGG